MVPTWRSSVWLNCLLCGETKNKQSVYAWVSTCVHLVTLLPFVLPPISGAAANASRQPGTKCEGCGGSSPAPCDSDLLPETLAVALKWLSKLFPAVFRSLNLVSAHLCQSEIVLLLLKRHFSKPALACRVFFFRVDLNPTVKPFFNHLAELTY